MFKPTSFTAVALLALAALVHPATLGPGFAQGPQSVAPIARKLQDAVVNISTAQKLKNRSGGTLPDVPEGSPFEDLFEDFFDKDQDDTRRKVNSLGSGFVIDGKQGLIVTNNHVIEGADEITIIFRSGRKLRVDKVLGVDPKTDLALLKVSPTTPLPEVTFGSSREMQVGDWVLAIGNPFGLGGSVSVGIISAKQRDIRQGPYDDYLQTDAAINKGNSGGPLFSMKGEVIGVNTAIISPTGGSIGIGFAVPSDVAKLVVSQLQKYGETRRGWLGVNIQSVTEDLAKSLSVPAGQGAIVSRVTPDGPAAKAGIQPGDVILEFNGQAIRELKLLPRIVARTEEGSAVDVVFLRDGERQVREVTVGRLQEQDQTEDDKTASDAKKDAPAGPNARAQGDADDTDGSKDQTGPILGLTVAVITPELADKFRLQSDAKGLVVTAIEDGSVAARKEFLVGDLIAEASYVRLSEPTDLLKQVERARAAGKRNILLRVVKPDGNFRLVAVPVAQ